MVPIGGVNEPKSDRELLLRIADKVDELERGFRAHCDRQFGTSQAFVIMLAQAILFFLIGKYA